MIVFEWMKTLILAFIIGAPIILLEYAIGDYFFGAWAAKFGLCQQIVLDLKKSAFFPKLFWAGYVKSIKKDNFQP